MRGRGSNPNSRYNLRPGPRTKEYWVFRSNDNDKPTPIEGPFSFDKAYFVAAGKNASEKTFRYFVDMTATEVTK